MKRMVGMVSLAGWRRGGWGMLRPVWVVVVGWWVFLGTACVSRVGKEVPGLVEAELANVEIIDGRKEVRFEGVFAKLIDGSVVVHLRKGGPGVMVALRLERDGEFLLESFGARWGGRNAARVVFFKPLLGLARGFAMSDGVGDGCSSFFYDNEKVFIEKRKGRTVRLLVRETYGGAFSGSANFLLNKAE